MQLHSYNPARRAPPAGFVPVKTSATGYDSPHLLACVSLFQSTHRKSCGCLQSNRPTWKACTELPGTLQVPEFSMYTHPCTHIRFDWWLCLIMICVID